MLTPSSLRSARWSWRRLHLASLVVRTLLVVQIGLAIVQFVNVPARVTAIDDLRYVALPDRSVRLGQAWSEGDPSPWLWFWLAVVTLVAFFTWLALASEQLDRPGDEARYEGWQAFTSVVVAAPWRPKEMMEDLVRVQREESRQDGDRVGHLVTVWWATWLVTALVAVVGVGLADSRYSVDDAERGLVVLAVVDVAVALCCILGCICVSRITRGQRAVVFRDRTTAWPE